MDLDECFKKELIKKTRINEGLIKSLIEMSDIKEMTIRNVEINKMNVSAYVSLAYDSLRETLEAICISRGYKVLSHICIGELLKNLLKDFDYEGFDRLRWIRNSINYYGTKIEFEQGKEIIEKIFAMKKKLREKHLNQLSKI